jgi:PAS domain S-box-containing protein
LIVAVAVANYVSGRLGLLLALPPGFSTAVWPPSGIALGAVLLFGERIWLGVWLGSFAMNIFIAEQSGPIADWTRAAVVAGCIALGSTAQALVGARLIRRWVGFPNGLLFEKDIILFLLLGGPLSCVIAPTAGIGTLVGFGIMPPSVAPFQWWTWWIGDTIGVLVIMPLLLIALAEPKDVWRGRVLSVGLPLVAAFGVAILFFIYSSRVEQAHITDTADRQTEGLAAAVQSSLEHKRDLMEFMAGALEINPRISRSEFRKLTDRVLPRLSGVQAMEWCPRVTQAQRAEFERAARTDGYRQFQITETGAPGLRAAGARDEYFPVYYVEPYAGNESALGYDLGADPIRLATLRGAQLTGQPTASPPLTLVQETGLQRGVLVALAVTRQPAEAIGGERRAELAGYLVMVLRIGDMMADVWRTSSAAGLIVALDDAAALDAEQQLLAPLRIGDAPDSQSSPEAGGPWSVKSIEFGGREWVLRQAPTVAAAAGQRSLVAWVVLAGGMLFTSLLGAFLLAVTGRAIHVRRLMNERAKADERFRLTVEAAPSAMIIVDQRGLITQVNTEAERLFRYRRDEMLGRSVEMLVPDGAKSGHVRSRAGYFSSVAPRTMSARRELYCITKDGSTVPVEIGLSPIHTDEGIVVLASILDITQRRQAERALTDANRSLAGQVEETQQAMARLQDTQDQLLQAEKLAALGDLVAGVSHEINTPVGIGITAASHLQDEVHAIVAASRAGALTRDQFEKFMHNSEEAAAILLRNLGRAAELIRSFKRIAVDQSTEEHRRINVKSYIDEILISLRPKTKHTQHRIVVDCPDDLQIDTVPGALSQIVTNLVVNALIHAFTPEHPGTMTIAVAADENKVTMKFADDGVGIPPEHLQQIFVPFFTTRRGQGGTGLGLSIVFSLVHQTLGGSIDVASSPGEGAVFTISFPAPLRAEERTP